MTNDLEQKTDAEKSIFGDIYSTRIGPKLKAIITPGSLFKKISRERENGIRLSSYFDATIIEATRAAIYLGAVGYGIYQAFH